MPSVPREVVALETSANRRAAVLARLSRAFARELGRVLRDLERSLLARVPALKAGSTSATIAAAQSLQLRRELREALRDAGYDRLATTGLEGAFTRLERTVAATTVGRQIARVVTQDVGLERLRALRVLAGTGLDYQGDEIAIGLWRSLVQGLFADRPVRDIIDDLAMRIDRSEAETRTLYDTAMATYTRTIEIELAPPGPNEAFLYTGPDDLKTRPFCQRHVGKVYTRLAITHMDNQTPDLADVLRHGGGYNCRHVWMHVPAGGTLADLADTDVSAIDVIRRAAA